MYGWINQCLEDLVLKNFGQSIWDKIREEAGCYVQSGEFIRSVHYDDKMTVDMVVAASKILGHSVEDLLELFGTHFVDFLEMKGYSGPIRGQGNNLREWIFNINEPHRLLSSRFPNGSLPEFWTEEDPEDSDCILLHYYSTREGGLGAIVVGVVKKGAQKYFNREVNMDLTVSETLTKSKFAYHGVWRISNVGYDSSDEDSTISEDDTSLHLSSSWRSEVSMSDAADTPRCPFRHTATISTMSTPTSAPLPSTLSMSSIMSASGLNPPVSLRLPRHPSYLPSGSLLSTSKVSTPRTHRSKSLQQNGVSIDAKTTCRVFPFHVAISYHMQIIQLGTKMSHMLKQHQIQAMHLPVGEMFSLAVADEYIWSWKELVKLQDTSITVHVTNSGALYGARFSGEVVIMGEGEDAVALLLINPIAANVDALMALHIKLGDLPRHSFQRDVLQIEEHMRSELQHSVEVTQLNQRLESESRRVKESLHALQTKRVFVRYVSHEIRTPLNIALLGLRCIEEEAAAATTEVAVLSPLQTSNSPSSDSRIGKKEATIVAEPGETEVTRVVTAVEKGQQELLDDIRISCTTAVDILNDLLLYEKMDDGLFQLTPSVMPVSSLLHEAERLFRVQAKAVEVELVLQLLPEVASSIVHVDRSKMHQVLRNLVSNAIKFTRPGGRVTISCDIVVNPRHPEAHAYTSFDYANEIKPSSPRQYRSSSSSSSFIAPAAASAVVSAATSSDTNFYQQQPDESEEIITYAPIILPANAVSLFTDQQSCKDQPRKFLRVRVTDSGCGISPEDQQRLFGQFVQFKAEQLQRGQGSGLGLWIAANIVHMHGGRVGATSPGEDKGSTFLVDLPLLPASSDSHNLSLAALSMTSDSAVSNSCLPIQSSLALEKSASISSTTTTESQAAYSISSLSPLIYTASTPLSASTSSSHPPSVFISLSSSSTNHNHQSRSSNNSLMDSTHNNQHYDHHNTNFSIDSNRKREDRPTMPQKTVSERRLSPSYRDQVAALCSQMRVLIVDDSVPNRKVLQRLLRSRFAEISEAENGLEAVQKYTENYNRQQKFEVVLMDGSMPVMDGLQATQRILTVDPQAVVVGLTGNAFDEDLQDFRAAGAVAVLTKPLNLAAFEDVLWLRYYFQNNNNNA